MTCSMQVPHSDNALRQYSIGMAFGSMRALPTNPVMTATPGRLTHLVMLISGTVHLSPADSSSPGALPANCSMCTSVGSCVIVSASFSHIVLRQHPRKWHISEERIIYNQYLVPFWESTDKGTGSRALGKDRIHDLHTRKQVYQGALMSLELDVGKRHNIREIVRVVLVMGNASDRSSTSAN